MSDTKAFTFEELKALSDKKNLHLLIHGKVYAIAKFLDEHPGGEDVLLTEAGKDATEAFEDVGHSDEAREILAKYLVGTGPAGGVPSGPKATRVAGEAKETTGGFSYLYPLLGLALYFGYKFYTKEA